MNKYRLVAKKGEGTFSEVLKAQCIKNGKYVAIKCMKNHFDSLDQVNNLREIQALRRLSPHPHIIKLLEVLYDQPTGRLALVFELMDMNIYELIRGRRHYVAEERVRSYIYQLMKALDHMHRNGIFHRDIKPENILFMDDVLKLADFGSCRGIYSKQPYTEYISTRWYRAPECLLTDGYYNYKMDMWGVGCVMFEIVALYPLFPGNNELDQIQKIHAIIGTPPAELLAKLKKRSTHSSSFDFPPCEGSGLAKMLSHVPPDCADLISKLLAYNPDERLSARQALRHPYFRERREADKRAKAAMQPDTLGSSLLASMDSEYSTQGPQQFGAAAVRRTDSGDLGDIAAAGAALGSSLQEPATGAGGGLNSVRRAAPAGAANAAAAAGVAGVLTEHLAAVAAAAAAAVAAAAAAAGGAEGKDSGGVGAHGMLPAIGNSSCPKPQLHHHKPPAQQQELVLPVQQLGQQQQPQQRHRQQPPAHHLQHTQQQQQHSLQPSHQLQQQPGHGPHDGMPLYGGSGAGSLKDRDGSTMQQLLAEASSMSHAALHGLGVGLGVQASSGSLWQEGNAVTLGPGAAGALLPPLVGSKAGVAGAALHTARRSSHLGGQGAGHHQQQHGAGQQQQHAKQHHSHPGAGAAGSSGMRGVGHSNGQVHAAHLASQVGLLQEQQQLNARHSHHGMQITSARYTKQGSKDGMLQPAGSLASSMTNLSSLHLGAAASSKAGRASGGMSVTSDGNSITAKTMSAAGGGSGRKPGSQYISPYGQQQRRS